MYVWRICKRIYAANPFSGEGGLTVGARWHRAGHRIVYTSATLSLAACEVWVNAPRRPLPSYVSVSASIPDDLQIEDVHETELPPNWRKFAPYPPLLATLGTNWLIRRTSAVLRVPSAVTPGEFNYLLNPEQADFEKIRPGIPQPFEFSPRMWKS